MGFTLGVGRRKVCPVSSSFLLPRYRVYTKCEPVCSASILSTLDLPWMEDNWVQSTLALARFLLPVWGSPSIYVRFTPDVRKIYPASCRFILSVAFPLPMSVCCAHWVVLSLRKV